MSALGAGPSRCSLRAGKDSRRFLKAGVNKGQCGGQSAGGGCWLGEHAGTGTQPRPMINIAYSCFLDETEGLVEGLQLPGPQAWILTIWSLQKKFAGF